MNRKTQYVEDVISLQNDCRLHTIPFKILIGCYIVLGKWILKLIQKSQT